ncbi:hypothetical protein ACFQYP_38030 [Nonomuraea antimicrobica]
MAANLTAFALTALRFYARTVAIGGGVLGDPPLIAGFRAMLAETGAGPHLPILALAEILRTEQRGGRLDPAIDAGAAASMLMGACFHRANLACFVSLPDDDESWAGTVVATLVRR